MGVGGHSSGCCLWVYSWPCSSSLTLTSWPPASAGVAVPILTSPFRWVCSSWVWYYWTSVARCASHHWRHFCQTCTVGAMSALVPSLPSPSWRVWVHAWDTSCPCSTGALGHLPSTWAANLKDSSLSWFSFSFFVCWSPWRHQKRKRKQIPGLDAFPCAICPGDDLRSASQGQVHWYACSGAAGQLHQRSSEATVMCHMSWGVSVPLSWAAGWPLWASCFSTLTLSERDFTKEYPVLHRAQCLGSNMMKVRQCFFSSICMHFLIVLEILITHLWITYLAE